MNRNVPRLVPFALALLAAPALAMAQSAPDAVTLHQNGQIVHVTSVEPDSIVGGYRIDFAKLDRNHDGYISRAEAKADPTLYAEFDAVDVHHHGRLSKTDLQGWMST
ncbi:hypothetical protein [Xanthomonas medicagonis]|uniref:hypothetical protein n=1 Tax=Xanthomonas medicagonis TaxID=3160841 RepID=UPI0035176591